MKKIMFNDKYGLTAAVLEGRKTMTRRVISPSLLNKIESFQDEYYAASLDWLKGRDLLEAYFVNHPEKLPYRVGDVVAVAQNYETVYRENGLETMDMQIPAMKGSAGWRNKMFVRPDLMPHHIRITGLRYERLQDISEADCMREGICIEVDEVSSRPYYFYGPRHLAHHLHDSACIAFVSLIDKVSGRGTWLANPWVLVYEFELEK